MNNINKTTKDILRGAINETEDRLDRLRVEYDDLKKEIVLLEKDMSSLNSRLEDLLATCADSGATIDESGNVRWPTPVEPSEENEEYQVVVEFNDDENPPFRTFDEFANRVVAVGGGDCVASLTAGIFTVHHILDAPSSLDATAAARQMFGAVGNISRISATPVPDVPVDFSEVA